MQIVRNEPRTRRYQMFNEITYQILDRGIIEKALMGCDVHFCLKSCLGKARLSPLLSSVSHQIMAFFPHQNQIRIWDRKVLIQPD